MMSSRSDPQVGGPSSKIWIVWMIVAGIVSGVAIALVALIPMRASDVAGEPPWTGQSPRDAAAEAAVSARADERAAIDAVELYFGAWRSGDCDAYFATTAEQYRMGFELTNCDSFVAASRATSGLDDNHVVIIERAETDGSGTVTVLLTELHTSMYDEDGNPTDARAPYEYRYHFTLLALDAGARITDAYYE